MKKISVAIFCTILLIFILCSYKTVTILTSGISTFLFGYPLVLTEVTKRFFDNNQNQFIHFKNLASAKIRAVVRPNTDTLYSLAFLDLTKGPIILDIPDTNDRYYILQAMDAWTNVFASLGKRTTGTGRQMYVFTGPYCNTTLTYEMKHLEIKSPTSMVLIIARFQVNGESDIKNVNEIQNKMTIRPYGTNSTIPNLAANYTRKVNQTGADLLVDEMDSATFFSLFSELIIQNPLAKDDNSIHKYLSALQIKPGKKWNSSNLSVDDINNLNESIKFSKKLISWILLIPRKLYNGWKIIRSDIGVYGTQYLRRAIISKIGYGSNTPEDAIYPMCSVGPDGKNLNGQKKYLLHFDKKEIPPVNAFWSITLYDSTGFFVDNHLNRYAIKNSDNFKYNSDGSLDIYIQVETPEEDLYSNWIPAPNDDFNLLMRLYWPDHSILSGEWNPPALKLI